MVTPCDAVDLVPGGRAVSWKLKAVEDVVPGDVLKTCGLVVGSRRSRSGRYIDVHVLMHDGSLHYRCFPAGQHVSVLATGEA